MIHSDFINRLTKVFMSHETKLLKYKRTKLRAVRKSALSRTAIALKTIREQHDLSVELDKRYLGELDIAKRGAEEAVLHLAIVAARAEDQEIDKILKSHGVDDILY